MMTVVAVNLLIASVLPITIQAQDANRQLLEDMGMRCLSEAPGELDAFRLIAPDSMPYLRSSLVRGWLGSGKRVISENAQVPLPLLRYDVRQASVTYRRLSRRAYERTASLNLEYTLTGPEGLILGDRICTDAVVDTVRVQDLAFIEDPAFAETIGERPPAGWVRRIVEPAVLVAAVGVGVFLFFSLRSTSGSG